MVWLIQCCNSTIRYTSDQTSLLCILCHKTQGCICLILYVEDIITTDSDHRGILQEKHHLSSLSGGGKKPWKTLILYGNWCGSIQGWYSPFTKYVTEIHEGIGFLDAKPIDTATDPSVKLPLDHGNPLLELGR